MAAATLPRAPVSSSSASSVFFFRGGRARPNSHAGAAGWRRREPYPAVSVAAGPARSPPEALAVDPKVKTLLDSVKWDSKGLAVAIAQNADTGAILMQGFANKEALATTISTRKATFYSRSRSSLWTKGETSMNYINVHDIFLDCDRDSIIYLGKPDGPTCHTGAETCYYSSVYDALQGLKANRDRQVATTLYSLEDTISRRKEEIITEGSGKPSWTKKLLLDNHLLCSKIREEASELTQTLLENEDKSRTASEMADLLYHAMVLLRVKDVKMEEVLEVRRKRFSQSGIEEKGPEIRTGFLKDGKPIQLKKGQEITISTDYTIKGDENMISMSYKKLAVDLKPGSVILCADGTITLTVLHCDKEQGLVRCRCENTSMLGERKNVNLPGVIVDLPTLTEKDKEDILKWGVPNKIDMIALSFVRKGSDLVEVRKVLGEHAKSIMLMSKVENQEGVANFDDILANSDAFMVARGDLGMEIPIEKIFYAQKVMIFKCNIQGKPVVTATQMLESMIKSPRPTRAEATDVANAVLDGTDCVMLSGETAAGAYPELAVQTMAKICLQAESCVDYAAVFKAIMASAPIPMSPLESLASSAVRTANSAKAAVILVLTRGGTTARLVAKYRPSMPILSVVVPELKTDSFDWICSDEGPARHSLIVRGVIPMLSAATAKAFDSEATEEALGFAIKNAKAMGLCNTGESVVALHRIGTASVIKLLTVN